MGKETVAVAGIVCMRNEKMKKLAPTGMVLLMLASLAGGAFLMLRGTEADADYKKYLLIIAGILLLIIAVLSVAYLYLLRETDPNFFLFDQDLQKNIPTEQLTFARVNERMDFYLSLICMSEEELWYGDLLARDDPTFGPEGVYRPLIVYKMLYDLTVADDDDHWSLIEEADRAKINLIVRALSQCRDRDLADAIVDLYSGNVQEGENIRDFLFENQKYLRGRMLRYVKQNIDLFY